MGSEKSIFFSIGSKSLPLLVLLMQCLMNSSFASTMTTALLRFLVLPGDRQAELLWDTQDESGLTGFAILRSEADSAGNYIVIASHLTDSALVARGAEERFSQHYGWLDQGLINTKTYWYKLGLVNLNNHLVLSDPVAVTPLPGLMIYRTDESLGWEWQNPLPGGERLEDLEFIDAQNGWLVGKNNTLLMTIDGGRSWKRCNSGLELPETAGTFAEINFKTVQFSDRLHGWISGFIYGASGDTSTMNELFILKTANGGATWKKVFQINSAASIAPTLYFLTVLDGWLSVYDTGIYRTFDGGDNWQLVGKHPPMFYDNGRYVVIPQFNSLLFTSADAGWAYKSDSYVFMTNNGGRSWTLKKIPVKGGCDLWFVTSQIGWIIDYYGNLFNTMDGGATWTSQYSFGGDYFDSLIRFKTADSGLVIRSNTLYRTSDGGVSWHSLAMDSSGLPLELKLCGDDRLWMLATKKDAEADLHEVFFSSDGGMAWKNIFQGIQADFKDIQFLSLEEGWAIGIKADFQLRKSSGLIISTVTGGKKWQILTQVPDYLVALAMINDREGLAVSGNYNGDLQVYEGSILRTTDNWQSYQRFDLENQQFCDVFIADARHAYACGAPGVLLYTKDGGENWHAGHVNSIDASQFWHYGLYFIDARHGWTTVDFQAGSPNYGALFETRSGGENWECIWKSEEIRLGEIVFTDSLVGWAIGGSPWGNLYQTTDGGYNWSLRGPVFPWEPFIKICFVDKRHGWALGQYGKIVYTEDGGDNWHQLPRLSSDLTSMTFLDPTHGWVVGYYGKILATSQAGQSQSLWSDIPIPDCSERVMNFYLHQNYPNPFNPVTKIQFELPEHTGVTMKIYNVMGQEVKTVMKDEQVLAGHHQVVWDGRDDNGQSVASGIYFCRIQAGQFSGFKKMVLLK